MLQFNVLCDLGGMGGMDFEAELKGREIRLTPVNVVRSEETGDYEVKPIGNCDAENFDEVLDMIREEVVKVMV